MFKKCSKCATEKPLELFGKLINSPDGLKYDCKECRSEYNKLNRERIKLKNKEYYENNKETLLGKNKEYRLENSDAIKIQRKEYREREEVAIHRKEKNKEYLPVRKLKIKERRKNDINFKLSEILRSKVHKMLKNNKTSYANYIGCDVVFLKKWLEFRFDENMNWTNLGSYWHIDHILPINRFDFTNERHKYICFHWTNLQPLTCFDNQSKSDSLHIHHYFNNIVNINRFNTKHTQFLGYQTLIESLEWLRVELRYGKNPSYEDAK